MYQLRNLNIHVQTYHVLQYDCSLSYYLLRIMLNQCWCKLSFVQTWHIQENVVCKLLKGMTLPWMTVSEDNRNYHLLLQ